MIRVGGLTYWEIKCRALNGGRAKLSAEQMEFVGFADHGHEEERAFSRENAWLQPINPSNIHQRLTELAEARDIAPGWYALARRIVGSEKETK